MRFKLAIQFTAVCLLGLSTALLAQQPGQGQGQPGGRGGRGFPGGPGFGGGMFGGGASRMGLLRIAEVRKELELADEQVAEIEKVSEEIRAKYPNAFGGRGGGPPGGGQGGNRGNRGGNNNNNEGASLAVPTQWYFVAAQDPQQGQGRGRGPQFTPEQIAEMEKARLERTREENAKLAEILLPNQLKRLNEIYVQQAGVAALQDEEIAKQLAISDAQKAQLTKIRDEFSAKRREMFQPGGGGGGGGGDFEAMRAKIIEMNKVQDEQLLAVLNPQQKAKFEEMKGKPFTMPEGGFGRGGGGPGGTRGRGGNRGTNN